MITPMCTPIEVDVNGAGLRANEGPLPTHRYSRTTAVCALLGVGRCARHSNDSLLNLMIVDTVPCACNERINLQATPIETPELEIVFPGRQVNAIAWDESF